MVLPHASGSRKMRRFSIKRPSIEELLIAKLAECTVPLMRIGEVENALFDLANSESDDLLHAIRSLNVESSELLEERIRDALATDQWIDKDKFMERFRAFTEMSMQNFSDISGWRFIESKTSKTASYIKELARSEAMSIKDFIEREAGEDLSGHSFRVGAAVDLLDKGVPLERIMLRGGWKSENTALKYLRNWDDSDWPLVG